jgi:hypothetical protein
VPAHSQIKKKGLVLMMATKLYNDRRNPSLVQSSSDGQRSTPDNRNKRKNLELDSNAECNDVEKTSTLRQGDDSDVTASRGVNAKSSDEPELSNSISAAEEIQTLKKQLAESLVNLDAAKKECVEKEVSKSNQDPSQGSRGPEYQKSQE